MDPLVFWAKSGDQQHPEGHSLLAHMLDTAAVVIQILEREPVTTRRAYAEDYGLADPQEASRLAAFFVGLHDLGKASAVFQVQWPAGWERVRSRGLGARPACLPERNSNAWVGHGVMTVVLVRALLPKTGVPAPFAAALAELLGAHHGFLATSREIENARYVLDCETGPWQEARAVLLDAYQRALNVNPPQTKTLSPAGQLRLMGLTSFADWLASSTEHFPYGRPLQDPGVYFRKALSLAEEALDRIRWFPRKPLVAVPPRFEEAFFPHPTPVQEAVVRALENAKGPRVIVIEAPMGGGKTEAAFYAHLKLQATNHHRGLYVAMPTTATGNAMFERVRRDLLQKFGDRPIDLQLVHGASFLNTSYLTLKNVGDPGENGEVMASEWFSAKKRAMLTEYGVGTVDQALLAVLRVRHHFVRLWGLGNRTVVLDEVHAYDAYTSRLIEGLVRWLTMLGSSVIIMSATLTRDRRHALLRAAGVTPPASEARYPRVTVVSPGKSADSLSVSQGERKIIAIHPAPREIPELVQLLCRKLEAGGAAAAVVNTVDRAQAFYQAFPGGKPILDASGLPLGKQIGQLEIYLFHARYPSEERQRREELVLRLFGKNSARPKKALLIATQVVEQSLDLDFDLIYTDLAPADLLLQRAGRLHRHKGTPRPTHLSQPQLWVGGLAETPPDLDADHWSRVYERFPLLTTWQLLRRRKEIGLPEDIEPLVEAAYDEATLEHLPSEMQGLARQALERWHAIVGMQRLKAEGAVVDPPKRLLDLLASGRDAALLRLEDEEESRIPEIHLTRLGDPSLTAVPAYLLDKGLYLDPEGEEPLPLPPTSPEEVYRIYQRSLRIAQREVYAKLKSKSPPPEWERHPLLRNLRVLELSPDGTAQIGRVRLHLDPELGLVYERQ